MKKTIPMITIFVLVIGNIHSLGQVIVSGVVVDQITSSPLPYANIYLHTNNKIGTITNNEGQFFLSLPKDNTDDSLVVSYIGYKKKYILIKETRPLDSMVVRLAESTNLLNEIIVTGEDTLLNFLKSAYDKIADNYPATNSLVQGFYRETNQVEDSKKFIYFSESTIQYYNPSYSLANEKKYGPVKICEGGKFEVKNRNSYSNIHFYAGLYSPQRFDFVKKRFEFIDPKHFSKYTYQVERIFEYGGRSTVVIGFKPNSNALFEGRLYIDGETLAYIKCIFNLSVDGLKKENSGNLSGFEYTSRSFEINYKLKTNKWHIWLVVQDGKGFNKKYNNLLRYTNEFLVSNEETVDKNPISDTDAIPFYAFYTSQTDKFSDDYWNRNDVFARSNGLDSTINLLYGNDSLANSMVKESTTIEKENKGRFKEKMLKFATNTSSGISLTIVPYKYYPGVYQVSYLNYFSLSNQLTKPQTSLNLSLDFKYYINNRTNIIIQGFGNLGGDINTSLISIGVQRSKRLVGWRKPLYLESGFHFYYSLYDYNMGGVVPDENFTVDGISFRTTEELNVGVGETRWGILGSTELIYKFHSRFSFFTKVLFSIYSQPKDELFLRRNKNAFLSLDKNVAFVDLSSNDVLLTKNSFRVYDSPVTFNNFQVIFSAGLRFGLSR